MASERLNTNLSVSPYFDDYDPTKQYVRILFVPQHAVQVREMNQMQAMTQEQIGRFADHIFKDGAVVDGVAVTYIPKQDFVYVENQATANTNLLSIVEGDYVLASASGVRAIPKKVIAGFVSQYPLSQRVYLDYITTGKDGSNNDVSTFSSGETLTIYQNQSPFGTLDSNNIVDTVSMLTQNSTVTNVNGTAYAVSTTAGTIYQKGFFLYAEPQYTLVNELSTNTTNRMVGFTTVESIVTEDGDSSLNDNANGTENVNAPGAHRLKMTPTLISVDKTTLSASTTFYPIVEFDQQAPVEDNTQNEIYNTLGEILSKRTYEESGDYVVSPFNVESTPSDNAATMNYVLSPGVASVKGRRIEFIGTKTVEVERAITTRADNAQIVSANYGNYVNVEEVVGAFNGDALETVSIYDAAQNSISEVEGAGSAPSGNVVGTATVRAFVYSSGTKGLASCVYRLYVTNIKMNTGKSFAIDAKSFYADGGYGKAKADIVLVNGKAVVADSAKESLIFPFGIGAIKRLTDADGNNDTQFVIRDSATATLQSNGYVVFNTNAPYAGGVERLNSSVGVLSDSIENQYDVVLSTEAYTANKTGTITASSNVVTGTGTAFTTEYSVGDMIRAGSGAVRLITAIANSTSLSLNASLTVTANTHSKYFPQGHVFNLTGGSATVKILSNTQFAVQVGVGTLASGSQTVRSTFPILRTQATAITKVVNKDRYVKIDCSTAGTGGTYNLGLVDAIDIDAVYFGTTYSDTNPNRATWFTLKNGQTSTEYGHAQLVVKPTYKSKLTSSTKLLVKLNHFTANASAGAGFFSADSYPLIDENDTANATNIAISNVYNIGAYDFRDVVDFRPQRYNTANSSTTIAGATVNPAAANTSYQITSSGAMLVAPDQNFQADVEYYLPRYDVLAITINGDAVVRRGEPDDKPKMPISDADTMVVASVFVPAYPSLTTRESVPGRQNMSTQFEIKTNRRYTMRDIGVLDHRISRLEYYATLSALEQVAKDMSVPDENGLDRFKNGIFADSFTSHSIGRTDYMEYKIAIDADEGIARPRYKKHGVDTVFDEASSTNIQRTGAHITLPYTSAVFVNQPYASKYRNCCESVWKWNGKVTLYPSYSATSDEQSAPAKNITIDTASAWEDFADTEFGTNFGDWRTTTNRTSNTTTSTTRGNNGSTSTARTTTTTSTSVSSRIVQELTVDTNTTKQEIGTYVTDVSENPYMISRTISFTGTGFKPNTRVYAFFDGVAVSAHCAQGVLSGLSATVVGKEERIVSRTSDFGQPLVTDSNGNVYGVFRIPPTTFRNGDRVFMLTNVDNLITGEDAKITEGSARFTASALSITTQTLSLTTIEPEISTSTSVQSVTNTTVTTSTSVTNTEGRSVGGRSTRRDSDGKGNTRDPIAQSFIVSLPTTSTATGMIVDKVGVYFKAKDRTLGITAKLLEMSNGYPNGARVIAKKYKAPADVFTSNNGSVETIFDFDSVAYLSAGSWYALMLEPDGNSPEYLVWSCETGGTDVLTQRQIFSSPYTGVLFVSANQSTWTAIQNEQLKFKLYRARFTATTGVAVFENEDDDYFTVDGFTYANASVSIAVGDIVYTSNGTAVQTSNTSPRGVVQSVNPAADALALDSSNGKFRAGDLIEIHRPFMNNASTIGATTKIASATIETINDYVYSAVVPRFAVSTPANTSIDMKFKGTSNTYVMDATAKPVTAELDTEFYDKERLVVSRSNEQLNMANAKSSKFYMTLKTTDDFMSPVIDLRRKTSLFIENIINNDVTDEHTQYGSALAKYISPIVTLAEGQDAEDIEVYLTAYRPAGTNLQVYFKALNAADTSDFDTKIWTKMTFAEGANTFGSTSNPNDTREYKFTLPTSAPVTNAVFRNASNFNIAEYIDGSSVRYIGFKQFAIKIVLTSASRLFVPRLHDVRALALQV